MNYPKQSNPSNTSHSNYLTTYISTTYSVPNRWDNISGKCYHSNKKIPNNSRTNNSFHESSNNLFCPYIKIHSLYMIDHGKQLTNIKKLSNKNKNDYRKRGPNNICYILSSQQKRYLRMHLVKPRSMKLRSFISRLQELNAYLEEFPHDTDDQKTAPLWLNTLVLIKDRKSSYLQSYEYKIIS